MNVKFLSLAIALILVAAMVPIMVPAPAKALGSPPNTYYAEFTGPSKLIGVTGHTYTVYLNLTSSGNYSYPITIGVENPSPDKLSVVPEWSKVNIGQPPQIIDEAVDIESPHPYTNYYDNEWTITRRGATRIRVFFDEISVESGFDYVYIYDGQHNLVARLTGTYFNYWSPWVLGDTIIIELRADCCINYWGIKISTVEYEIAAPPTKFETVIESPHPYPNNYDKTWTYTIPGATYIKLHFERISLERGFDWLYVMDADDNVVAEFTGLHLNFTTDYVAGNTVKIRLVSDEVNYDYGFKVDYAEAILGSTVMVPIYIKASAPIWTNFNITTSGYNPSDPDHPIEHILTFEFMAVGIHISPPTLKKSYPPTFKEELDYDVTLQAPKPINNHTRVDVNVNMTWYVSKTGNNPWLITEYTQKKRNIHETRIETTHIESPHPYPNNYHGEWVINHAMAGRIRVHFQRISVEYGYDYIYIMDEANHVYQSITGYRYDYWSNWVPGSYLKIVLVSDNIINYYGFVADEYEWAYTDSYVEMSAWNNYTHYATNSTSFYYIANRYDYRAHKFHFSIPYFSWMRNDPYVRVRIGFEVDVYINGTLYDSTLTPAAPGHTYTLFYETYHDDWVNVGDFSVTPSVDWITVEKGQTGIVEFTVKSLGGYTGDLKFVVEGLPENVHYEVSNETFTLGSGETVVIKLELTVPELGVAAGTYMLTVKVIDLNTGVVRTITPIYFIVA